MSVLLVASAIVLLLAFDLEIPEVLSDPVAIGSLLSALVTGYVAETWIYLHRYKRRQVRRLTAASFSLVVNAGSAIVVGLLILGILASPILNSIRTPVVLIGALLLELAAVVFVSSNILCWWTRRIRAPEEMKRMVVTVAMGNLGSMIAGILGWRLFLLLFYPGVG
jgi:hypothetical protein